MTTCPRCGSINADGAAHCAMCGTLLPDGAANMVGQQSQDDSRFRPPAGYGQAGAPVPGAPQPEAGPRESKYQPGSSPASDARGEYDDVRFPQSPRSVPVEPWLTSEAQPEYDSSTFPIAAPVAAPAAHPRAASPAAKRWTMAAAIVLIVAIAVAAGVARYVSVQSDPRKVVESYLAAIQEGRLADAAAMDGTSDSLGEEKRALLTNDAIPNANARISDYAISDRSGYSAPDTHGFNITYTVGGMDQSYMVELKKDGRDGMATKWRFTRNLLGNIDIYDQSQGGLSALTVNGIGLSAANAMETDSSYMGVMLRFAAYPGVYALSSPDGVQSPYLTTAFDQSAVTLFSPSDTPSVEAGLTVTDTLVGEVNSRLSSFYDSCIAAADAGQEPDEACDITWIMNHSNDPSYSNETYAVATAPSVTADDFYNLNVPSADTLAGSFTAYNGAYTHAYDFLPWYSDQADHYETEGLSWIAGTFTADADGVDVTWGTVF